MSPRRTKSATDAATDEPIIGNCPECDAPIGDGYGCPHWPATPSAEPPLPAGYVPLASVATVWDRLRLDRLNAAGDTGADQEGEDEGHGGKRARRRAAPFVKWAGGKRSLLAEMGERLPGRINNYFEPLVGGGALFFALADAGLIRGQAVLIDSVPELMTTYKIVRDQVEELIVALEVMARRHALDQDAGITGPTHYYYTVRDRGIPDAANELAVAARFICLNRTCFNGLYRVNAKGRFNVPMGTYKHPRILDAAGLRAASRALNATRAILLTADFGALEQRDEPPAPAGVVPVAVAHEDAAAADDMVFEGGPVFDGVEALLAHLDTIPYVPSDEPVIVAPAPAAGDFVYIDPPYIPLVKTSFTRYTAPNFGLEDQERLRDLVLRLTATGVFVMASNSKTLEALALYDDPRLHVETVEAPRQVNSKAEGRGPVEEILVTNYGPGAAEVGVA